MLIKAIQIMIKLGSYGLFIFGYLPWDLTRKIIRFYTENCPCFLNTLWSMLPLLVQQGIN